MGVEYDERMHDPDVLIACSDGTLVLKSGSLMPAYEEAIRMPFTFPWKCDSSLPSVSPHFPAPHDLFTGVEPFSVTEKRSWE